MERFYAFAILACILLLGLSGCITSVRPQQSGPTISQIKSIFRAGLKERWKGHHISELIQQKGPANQIAADGAGGQIYVWVEDIEMQRRVKKQPLSPRVPKKTKTQGVMRRDPLFQQWEFEAETVPARTEPPDGAELLLELHRQRRTETYTTRFRIMIYTRPDGTIYHGLID